MSELRQYRDCLGLHEYLLVDGGLLRTSELWEWQESLRRERTRRQTQYHRIYVRKERLAYMEERRVTTAGNAGDSR